MVSAPEPDFDLNAMDKYTPHVKIVPKSDNGWQRVVPEYDPGGFRDDYWVEVGRKVDSGYVRYDDTKSGIASVALPVGYDLYSYRYEELSVNGEVSYTVVPAGPDSVRVTYTVKSEGDLFDQTRGWLSLQVYVRGRLIDR